MENKRLIDANAVKRHMVMAMRLCGKDSITQDDIEYCIDHADTVYAVSVEEIERIICFTPGLELWDYQKRGIMRAVNQLCGKEKDNERKAD